MTKKAILVFEIDEDHPEIKEAMSGGKVTFQQLMRDLDEVAYLYYNGGVTLKSVVIK